MNVNTWWYGFKEAEQLYYEGYVPDYNDFTIDYIYFVKGYTMVGIPLKDFERRDGVLSYIQYWDSNKDRIKYVHSITISVED
jgi:hypothetical protein